MKTKTKESFEWQRLIKIMLCRPRWSSSLPPGTSYEIKSLGYNTIRAYLVAAGKESTCNAGDPGSILGLGRSLGEGIGYPLQYPWASLVAQLVKNPAISWSEMATHSSILCLENPMDRGVWQTTVCGVARVGHDVLTKLPHVKIKTSV